MTIGGLWSRYPGDTPDQRQVYEAYRLANVMAIHCDAVQFTALLRPAWLRRAKVQTREQFMARYPRITAHIICCSLGYATPTTAAAIGLDALHRRENWCEWIYSCYRRNARAAVQHAIRCRRGHRGYMANYADAKALVDRALAGGGEPLFASWF